MTFRRRGPLPLIPVALALAVFWPVIQFAFLDWDDWIMVVQNPDFNPPTWSNLAHYWTEITTGHIQHYVPLTYTTYAGLTWLSVNTTGTLAPQFFHLANLLLHLLTCVFVFYLLRDLFKDDWPALAGAAIFAIHPVQTEPISWIASLNTVLSGMLGTLALWLYVRHVRDKRPRARRFFYIAATLVALLAMFAKPSAMILPLLAGVIDWYLLQRPLKTIWKPLAPWLILGLLFALIQKIEQPASAMAGAPIWSRPLIALDTIGFYVTKILLPWVLSPEYGRTPQWLLHSWQLPVTVFIAFAIAALAWAFRRQFPELLGGLLLLIASIAPVLGLVTFEFQRYSTVADRYLYMGMIGIGLIVAAIVSRWPSRAVWVCISIAVVLLGTRSFAQVWVWRNTPALLAGTIRANPNSQMAHKIAGYELARDHHYREAIFEYLTALSIRADDPDTQLDLANAYVQTGLADKALSIYADLEKTAPPYLLPRVEHGHGIALQLLQRSDEAGPHFQRAATAAPKLPEVWLSLGRWQEDHGQWSNAIISYQHAVDLRPDSEIAKRALERVQSKAAASRPTG